jgi:hypothetical protein
MRCYYVPCHVCGSFEQEALFPSTYRDAATALQSVGICRQCGLLYRNPLVPELCAPQYSTPSDWNAQRPPTAFSERFVSLTSEISSRVELGAGQLFLDVGAGPGWLAEHLEKAFPSATPVLLEPAPAVAADTKTRHPRSIVLPGTLSEVSLPHGSFSLIVVCGVDYLFHNHRADLQTLNALLDVDGVLYIERNVFLDQQAYFRSPILDMDDMCGVNPQMNTWFSRPQFAAYLEEFFDVFATISYISGESPPPYQHHRNVLSGFFCRKRAKPSPPQPSRHTYDENIAILRKLAETSSLEDLQRLRTDGIRTVIICGRGDEARSLAEMIRRNDLFAIAGFVEPGTPPPTEDALSSAFVNADSKAALDAFLLASVNNQETYLTFLQQMGHADRAWRCFRPGLKRFTSEGPADLQLKAFLPSYIRRYGPTNVPSEWGINQAPR